MRSRQAACAVIALLLAGCASTSSTLLDSENSASCPTTVKGKGVPVTLKVATHLRVTITEQQYFEPVLNPQATATDPPADGGVPPSPSPDAGTTGTATTADPASHGTVAPDSPTALPRDPAGRAPGLRQVLDNHCKPIRTYDYTTQVIETDTIVLVDQKRPAAGTIAYRSSISKDYSLREMQGSVEDVSIRQIGYGIASTIAALTGQNAPTPPTAIKGVTKFNLSDLGDTGNHTRPEPEVSKRGAGPTDLLIQDRVIATRVFDLNDPDLELQISEFLAASLPAPIR